MKQAILLLAAVFCLSTAEAKTVKTTFEVKGNCGMCQKRIEAAAKTVKGVTSARWNKQTGQLSLVYDNKQASPEQVQKAIATAGHDSGTFKADAAVYSKLPGCCKYRENAKKH
ncbi:MAG: heavy-metal-associated domain-containing protein [Prevotella sp.]|nr:heavy-metal-associated domain-containing protein [Prevotella sp.]